jgi:altronate hydrolase
MVKNVLKLDPRDNVLVALIDLKKGDTVVYGGATYVLPCEVPRKHKFVTEDQATGELITMYGVTVGRVVNPIPRGGLVTVHNVRHQAAPFSGHRTPSSWSPPDTARWRDMQFAGFHRADGQVGTRNYWLVIPLVFCENRNIDVLQEAFEQELGYAQPHAFRQQVAGLAERYRQGQASGQEHVVPAAAFAHAPERLFKNVDGVRFLTHQGGCGGTREDSRNLCGLIAGYIHHPNVAGATVLSLGCQNAEIAILHDELKKRDAQFCKPLFILDQQTCGTEASFLSQAVQQTFSGLVQADALRRAPAPLSKLTLGVKCGGSDGFSGISANPAVGYAADILTALGGGTILAEFPELCGVEQGLIDRCSSQESADRFVGLMRDYADRAKAARSGFEMNPSPGNIQDGLITDAMKSAGAARKGGTSLIEDVLDFPEYATRGGLNLLCTPGNDVECVTAQVGAGATVVLFTTGLGTPTGNPVAPVVKISSNTALAQKMPDIIDFDAGHVISGDRTIEQTGEDLLERVVAIASGGCSTKAELLGQNDFIPWKRGISL